jgi:osmoprotectant transport system permease protein
MQEYFKMLSDRWPDLLELTLEHVMISGTAVFFGCLIAIPAGILLSGNIPKWVQSIVFSIANIFQTIPSLALLALLIPLFGIGTRPAIFALFLYSLLPILRNTYSGFRSVDSAILEAARGMGYNRWQQLWTIQFPLAVPYVLSGVRVTAVYVISWTALATLIGAGGLGEMIFSGLAVNRHDLVFTGALAAILLALGTDAVLGGMERRFSRLSGRTGGRYESIEG